MESEWINKGETKRLEGFSEMKTKTYMVEAGGFQNRGGWTLDTQFTVNMGSPYLIAHGTGNPVSDAKATFSVTEAGEYRLFAFTKNWVAGWAPSYTPGVFTVTVNGREAGFRFGNNGVDWGWQYGGIVTLGASENTIGLRDLSGFDGRCATLLLTCDDTFVPPDDINAMTELRRRLNDNTEDDDGGSFDLIVAGAGIAGICTALSAARRGLRVALVQDREVVGGNNSSEVRVWLGGRTCFEPFPRVGSIVEELEQRVMEHYGPANRAENYEDDKKLALLESEKNITLFLGHILTACQVDNARIKSVTVYNIANNRYKRLTAPLYSDCTGDATLGFEAGAHYEQTTNFHMGMSNWWCLEDTGKPQSFPLCPWAIDLRDCDFPGRKRTMPDKSREERARYLGCWFWEAGMETDAILSAEQARDTNLRAMYGAVDCLKNHDGDFGTYRLGGSCIIGGKRESRRLLGDVILTKADVSNRVDYEDACVPATWNFDVHYPDITYFGAFAKGGSFLTKAWYEKYKLPYFIPYRCLYSRNIGNLFMAGRNISVTHDALGATRVMRTGGMMGEVNGAAAFLCAKYGCTPSEVYRKHLSEFVNEIR